MRSFAIMFAGLMIGVAAIAATAGCPPGVPWVPDGYANAKFVPAHCLGEPSK